MKLAARAAEDFLRAPTPKVRGVLIYGPDEGQVRERAAALALKIVEDPADPFRVADLGADTLAGDPTRLIDEANALSLLGGRRLVRVRDATDKVTTACTALGDNAVASDSLVIVEGGDLTPRSSLRKLFEASPALAAIACYVDDEASLSRLIRETLVAEKVSPDGDAVAYLAAALLGDRALARRALEKLLLYLGADGKTPRKLSLDDAVAAIGDAGAMELDDAVRAAADGDRAETDRALARLFAEGTSPIGILRVAQGYFRRLHLARSAVDRGDGFDAAISALRPPVFFKQAPQFRRHVERWQLPMIARVLDRLIECEAACKRTGAPDELLTSRTFILTAQMVVRGQKL